MYQIVHLPLFFLIWLAVDFQLNQVTEALTKMTLIEQSNTSI